MRPVTHGIAGVYVDLMICVMLAEMNGGAVPSGEAPLGRRIVMYAVMLAIVFLGVEFVSFVTITLSKSSGVFYDPSMVTQNYDEYLKRRDTNLGWGPSLPDATRHDPVFPIDTPLCLSLFGDFFTWSTGVADEDAWGPYLLPSLNAAWLILASVDTAPTRLFSGFVCFHPQAGWCFLIISLKTFSATSTNTGTCYIPATNSRSSHASSIGIMVSNWCQRPRSQRQIFRSFYTIQRPILPTNTSSPTDLPAFRKSNFRLHWPSSRQLSPITTFTRS